MINCYTIIINKKIIRSFFLEDKKKNRIFDWLNDDMNVVNFSYVQLNVFFVNEFLNVKTSDARIMIMMMRREKNMMLLLLLQKNNSYYYNHCIKTVYILLIDKECIYIVPTKITTSCYLFFLSFCFFSHTNRTKIDWKS